MRPPRAPRTVHRVPRREQVHDALRHATHDTRRHAASVIPVWVCGRCGVRVGTIVSQSVRCVIVSGRWVRESRITMVTDCGRRQAAAAAVRAQSRSRVSCCRSLTHSLSVSQSPARSFVRSFVVRCSLLHISCSSLTCSPSHAHDSASQRRASDLTDL